MADDAPDHAPGPDDDAGRSAAAAPGAYLAAVERFWLLLRRRGLMISAEDVRQVERWRDAGLPVRLVCRALLEGAERFRSTRPHEPLPSTLRYFRDAVAEAADRWREDASVGARRADARPAAPLAGGLAALAAELTAAGRAERDERARASYRGAWRRLERLRRRLARAAPPAAADVPGDLLEALVAIDRSIVDDLLARLSDDERADVDRAVAAALLPEVDRLGARARDERRRALLEDVVTHRYRLLRLVPAPPGGPTVAGMGWWRPGPDGDPQGETP